MTAAARGARWTKTTLTAGQRVRPRRAERLIRRTGAPRAPFVLLVIGLLVGGLCALLALNTAAAAAELRRQSLTTTSANLADNVQQLKNDLAQHEAPQALANAATELGMVPNNNPAFLQVQPNGTVKVLGQPAPVAAPAVPAPAPPPAKPTTTAPAKPGATKPGTAKSATAKPAIVKPAPKPTPMLPPIVSPVGGPR